MIKVILISFVIFVILVPLSVFLAFDGAFDKKYSREELTQNFVEHEKAFSDVQDFFVRHLPKGADFSVTFGLGRRSTVNLYLYPDVIDPANKIVGGDNLEIGSRELDSALLKLGWTNKIIRALREKLPVTDSLVKIYGRPIDKSGFGNRVVLNYSAAL